jgi:N-acylneuraminate cytidylyltransferase
LLRNAGIKTGIITSENTKIVERRAAKLKADYLVQGKREGGKLAAAMEICEKEGVSLDEVAYIGDDVNCMELLCSVAWAACPNDAIEKIKNIPNITVVSKNGGNGVVREVVEKILK